MQFIDSIDTDGRCWRQLVVQQMTSVSDNFNFIQLAKSLRQSEIRVYKITSKMDSKLSVIYW